MSILTQSTIANKVSLSGIGVHTGEFVNLNILPSSPNSGIIFKRIDLQKNNIIVPNFENVSEATLCTTISNEYGVKVSTIEHLMAALLGLGIDNAIVEVDSQEVEGNLVVGETYYKNYEEVDGILFAKEINQVSQAIPIPGGITFKVDSINLNVETDESDFN